MSAVEIAIELPLPVGSAIIVNGQRWEVRSVEPYTCRDGAASHLVIWTTHCPACGVEVEHKPLGGTMLPHGKLSPRCPDCRGGAWGHPKKS